jgi:hypothetical protein
MVLGNWIFSGAWILVFGASLGGRLVRPFIQTKVAQKPFS